MGVPAHTIPQKSIDMRSIRVWLWGIVAELEYKLYPWVTDKPPKWAVERYNLDITPMDPYDEERIYFDWIKGQNEKINKIEENIIQIYKRLEEMDPWDTLEK